MVRYSRIAAWLAPRLHPGTNRSFNHITCHSDGARDVHGEHLRRCRYQVGFLSRPDAMATVGLTESLLTLMYAIAIGLSIGATATVARRIERRSRMERRVRHTSPGSGLIVSAVVALIGAPLAPKLLSIMGASPEVVAQGWGFTTIMLAATSRS